MIFFKSKKTAEIRHKDGGRRTEKTQSTQRTKYIMQVYYTFYHSVPSLRSLRLKIANSVWLGGNAGKTRTTQAHCRGKGNH